MNAEELAAVVARLDAIDAEDPEEAHALADDLVLEVVPLEVFDAYCRLISRSGWWAFA